MKPITYFESVWSRSAILSGLHSYLEKNVSSVLQPDELLRAEWVARVSALDLYVHELVAQSMVEIFDGRRPVTPAYLKFQVSSETMHRIRRATSPADGVSAFDLFVREQLSRITYQFPDDIADGIRLCSSVELWNEVALLLGATQAKKKDFAKDLKRQLSIIVRRRNSIAHEGDLMQTSLREPWPISKSDLTLVSSQIEQVVRAIDLLV